MYTQSQLPDLRQAFTGRIDKPVSQHRQIEDPLEYLPCSTILAYSRRQTIYGQDQPSTNIYLIIEGKVTITRFVADSDKTIVFDVHQTNDFFGESSFLGGTRRESAVTIEATKLMTWTIAEIEEIAIRRPRLLIALAQLMTQRTMGSAMRIESFAVDNAERRLVRTLLCFSERFGRRMEDGSLQTPGFSHELLAQYVGTSREVVTHHMNRFRSAGYLSYSRKEILLREDELRQWLAPDPSQSRRIAA